MEGRVVPRPAELDLYDLQVMLGGELDVLLPAVPPRPPATPGDLLSGFLSFFVFIFLLGSFPWVPYAPFFD